MGLLFGEIKDGASELDVVMYTANLVSHPGDVNPVLNELRRLTAQKQGYQQFTAAETTALEKIYLKLEEYLTTKEPLRKISREDLRLRLPQSFQERLAKQAAA